MGEMRNIYKVLVRKCKESSLFWKLWVNRIMILQQIFKRHNMLCDQMHLAQDRD